MATLDRWFGKEITNITPPASEEPLKAAQTILYKRVAPKQLGSPSARLRRGRSAGPILAKVGLLKPQLETCELGRRIYALQSMKHSDAILSGLYGEICVTNSKNEHFGSIPLNDRGPVRCIAEYSPKEIVACSDAGISKVDVAEGTDTGFWSPEQAYGFTSIDVAGHLILAGSSNGSAYICDGRSHEIIRNIYDAHDPQRRLRKPAKTRGPPVCSVGWVDGQTTVTASTQSKAVKFWDLRKSSASINSVDMVGRPAVGGICSVQVDTEGKAWALAKNGSLQSMMSKYEHPIDVYTHHTPLSSYQTNMCMLAVGGQSLLAFGTMDGLTFVNRPHLREGFSYNNRMAARTLEPQHAAGISKLAWNAATSTLLGSALRGEVIERWACN